MKLSMKKVAEYLHNATYPFLYYYRSTPPKSEKTFAKADAEYIMKMKLALYFMDTGYYSIYHSNSSSNKSKLIYLSNIS